MQKWIAELSGEHDRLPAAELACLGTVLFTATQVAIFKAVPSAPFHRLALTHTVMEYIGECKATFDAFEAFLADASLKEEKKFCGRMRKMADAPGDLSTSQCERLMGYYIKGQVSVSAPEIIYRVIVAGDTCYIGKIIWEIDRDPYHARKPGNRPFFHPGVMMPRNVRVLVNLSLAQPGDCILDPFAGTGGTLIEAQEIEVASIGSDADVYMIEGLRKNLSMASCLVADATKLPFQSSTISHIVTDLPYGQSVCLIGAKQDTLYSQSLSEMARVLMTTGRAVVVSHIDVRHIAEKYFDIENFFEQRIHKSLTRRIMVLQKR
ncbi:MAG: RNA methyltransferase [Methanomicrobiales archaeon]|jgi:tRNA (guanine10-N2)-dimethyltransferase|nr:RNA methyltransferase [Methanomicrobiales archaeon]